MNRKGKMKPRLSNLYLVHKTCILKAYFSMTFIYRIVEAQVPRDFNFQRFPRFKCVSRHREDGTSDTELQHGVFSKKMEHLKLH